jgi:hypothetical protein
MRHPTPVEVGVGDQAYVPPTSCYCLHNRSHFILKLFEGLVFLLMLSQSCGMLDSRAVFLQRASGIGLTPRSWPASRR